MEARKSRKADLERLRPWVFAAALAGVTVLFLAVLQIRISPDDDFDQQELVEMFTVENELGPVERPENLLTLAPKAEEKPKVRIVKAEEEDPLEQQKEEETMEREDNGDLTEVEEEPQKDVAEPRPDPEKLRIVEEMPQFPGGMTEFVKWLARNLKYPATAQNQKVQGHIVAQFIVGEDGVVSDIKLIRPLCRDCDEEALRVLRLMPRWTPGIENDRPCRTMVQVPIVFKL